MEHQYRREIDGLRSIAVLSVVLYHFSVPGVVGGFVGVDIFFVISGFLIGSILWRKTAEDNLSLKEFYVRRIRRLLPAFFVMTAVTFSAAFLVFMPFELRELGKGIITSTTYLSNIYFFLKSGYFDIDAEYKAFLHTWSLSIEEQFYVFLPLLFLILKDHLDF